MSYYTPVVLPGVGAVDAVPVMPVNLAPQQHLRMLFIIYRQCHHHLAYTLNSIPDMITLPMPRLTNNTGTNKTIPKYCKDFAGVTSVRTVRSMIADSKGNPISRCKY